HHFLDARRVDAPVGDELGESQLRHLAAHGVEAGEQHRLGGVVDDQVDARERLEGADVAPLAADDAALHGVVGDGHHRDADGGRHLGGAALDRLRDDVLRALARLVVGALQRGARAPRLLALQLLVDALEHLLLGLLARQLRHLLQAGVDLGLAGAELLLARGQLGGALVEALLDLVEAQRAHVLLLAAAVEALLELVELVAVALQLLALLAHGGARLLGLLAGARELLLGGAAVALQVLGEALALAALVLLPAQACLRQLGLHLRGGLVGDALRLALGLGQARLGAALGVGLGLGVLAALERPGGHGADHEAEREQQQAVQEAAHSATSSTSSSARLGAGAPLSCASTSSRTRAISCGSAATASAAFSLPCPRRVSPNENHEPDLVITPRSAATVTRSPSLS